MMGQTTSGIPTSRSSSNGIATNNLPPVLFHSVHGDNIRISRDGTVAKRAESFCKGIVFSARPIRVNEKICIKFLEISNNWSGVIRFGFTYNDPSTLRYGLPKYACPDLTNKPGYWAKALQERFCSQNTVLFYYVTSCGDVHFGINGEEKGIFFSGVETRGPLWALIDVYGNSTAIEFVDIRHQLNNSRRNYVTSPTTMTTTTAATTTTTTPDEDVDRIVYSMQQARINQRQSDELNLPVLRHQPSNLNFVPMPLHRTRGRNIVFNGSRNVASRIDTEFCQGYVFTARPLHLGERVVIQVLATEPLFQGCLGLGLTSCDPSLLEDTDLPDDSNFLLDRPEYWVLSKDFARYMNPGDEISFCIAPNGEVQISRNGGAPSVVIHVDQTLKLWAFFDVYGSTRRIRVLNCPPTPTRGNNVERRIVTPTSTNSESMNSLNSQSEQRRNNRLCCVTPADIQVQPSANGGTVLSVILSPTHANLINQQQQQQQQQPPANHHHQQQQLLHHHATSQSSINSSNSNNYNNHQHPSHCPSNNNNSTNHHHHHHHPSTSHTNSNHPQQQPQQQHVIAAAPQATTALTPSPTVIVAPIPSGSTSTTTLASGTMLSTCSSTYIEPISSDTATLSTYSSATWLEQNGAGSTTASTNLGADCTICYENPIDAVLYMCGHMCMCYECALQQWRGKGGGHCPLCRAVIRDVIRTYKS